MSGILIKPVENTMALGGVATGNMKANEHATADEIIKYSGCCPREIACRKHIAQNLVMLLIILLVNKSFNYTHIAFTHHISFHYFLYVMYL